MVDGNELRLLLLLEELLEALLDEELVVLAKLLRLELLLELELLLGNVDVTLLLHTTTSSENTQKSPSFVTYAFTNWQSAFKPPNGYCATPPTVDFTPLPRYVKEYA